VSAIADPAAFIARETRLQAPPHVPEISLHLADEAMDLWSRTEDELGEIGLPPPFWAFAWAGGQALARYVLDHPELVAGCRVLDFASGSGIVAIAAMKAGALSCTASASDRDFLSGPAEGFDVVLAGDVFYEKPMADRVEPFLRRAEAAGALVLFGDPGRAYLPRSGITQIADYRVPVTRAIEDSEIKHTKVWRFT